MHLMLTVPITITLKKAYCGIPARVHPHLPGLTLKQYTTWLAEDGPRLGSHSRLFQGWLLSVLLTLGALSDPVLIYTDPVFIIQEIPGLKVECNYSASTLSWQVRKTTNNSAVLHAVIMGLALINCTHEGACHTWKLGVTKAWESAETKKRHTFWATYLSYFPHSSTSSSFR